VSPLWQAAKLLRAFAKRFIPHRLERFESLTAFLTRIFVSWHEQSGWASGFQNDAGKSALNKLQFNLFSNTNASANGINKKRRKMTPEKVLTKHPLGKSGRRIDRNKYETLKKAILSALRKNELTHTELFGRLNKNLNGKFSGNINWYGETVKLDLEAKKIIERTASKPQRYRPKSR
jgi:hypothetical protein